MDYLIYVLVKRPNYKIMIDYRKHFLKLLTLFIGNTDTMVIMFICIIIIIELGITVDLTYNIII